MKEFIVNLDNRTFKVKANDGASAMAKASVRISDFISEADIRKVEDIRRQFIIEEKAYQEAEKIFDEAKKQRDNITPNQYKAAEQLAVKAYNKLHAFRVTISKIIKGVINRAAPEIKMSGVSIRSGNYVTSLFEIDNILEGLKTANKRVAAGYRNDSNTVESINDAPVEKNDSKFNQLINTVIRESVEKRNPQGAKKAADEIKKLYDGYQSFELRKNGDYYNGFIKMNDKQLKFESNQIVMYPSGARFSYNYNGWKGNSPYSVNWSAFFATSINTAKIPASSQSLESDKDKLSRANSWISALTASASKPQNYYSVPSTDVKFDPNYRNNYWTASIPQLKIDYAFYNSVEQAKSAAANKTAEWQQSINEKTRQINSLQKEIERLNDGIKNNEQKYISEFNQIATAIKTKLDNSVKALKEANDYKNKLLGRK